MRILQVHNYYATRGGECVVVDAEKQLLESSGHEVLQYTRDSKTLGDWSLMEKGYAYLHIPYNKRIEHNLMRFIKAHDPDVAHIHNVFPLISPAAYTALKQCRVPVIHTLHNFRFLCPNGTFFIGNEICERCQTVGFRSAVYFRCMQDSLITSAQYARAVRRVWQKRLLSECVDRFIALSEFSADKLVAGGIPQEKIEICGNFVTKVLEAPREKDDYLLYIGRLSPEKGIQTLLEAALASRVQIKIAGSGPLEEDLRAAAKSNSNIDFVSYVEGEQKERLISRARAMVIPSEWYEVFGLTVIEAMSLGTPVIASRIGGLPELVIEGKTGMLFEPGDINSLVRCMEFMVENTEKAAILGRNALVYVRERFTQDEHVSKLERIYEAAKASHELRECPNGNK